MIGNMPESLREGFCLYADLKIHRQQVTRSEQVIEQWLSHARNPYVAFSTGKDSLVTLDLIWRKDPRVPAVYFDADCAFPESKAMLNDMQLKGLPLIRFQTEESFLDTLRRMGMDHPRLERETMITTVWRPIKHLLEKYHFDGVALGLRGEECLGRERLAQFRGQMFWQERDNVWECLPIANWRYNDVWAYIVSRGLSYCGVYDRLWDAPQADQRLSYWAGETKRRWGRYAWLKRNYPELWNRLAAEFPLVRKYT